MHRIEGYFDAGCLRRSDKIAAASPTWSARILGRRRGLRLANDASPSDLHRSSISRRRDKQQGRQNVERVAAGQAELEAGRVRADWALAARALDFERYTRTRTTKPA